MLSKLFKWIYLDVLGPCFIWVVETLQLALQCFSSFLHFFFLLYSFIVCLFRKCEKYCTHAKSCFTLYFSYSIQNGYSPETVQRFILAPFSCSSPIHLFRVCIFKHYSSVCFFFFLFSLCYCCFYFHFGILMEING